MHWHISQLENPTDFELTPSPAHHYKDESACNMVAFVLHRSRIIIGCVTWAVISEKDGILDAVRVDIQA